MDSDDEATQVYRGPRTPETLWHVNLSPTETRTMSAAEIGLEYGQGRLDPQEAYVWCEGMPDWVLLAHAVDFLPLLAQDASARARSLAVLPRCAPEVAPSPAPAAAPSIERRPESADPAVPAPARSTVALPEPSLPVANATRPSPSAAGSPWRRRTWVVGATACFALGGLLAFCTSRAAPSSAIASSVPRVEAVVAPSPSALPTDEASSRGPSPTAQPSR